MNLYAGQNRVVKEKIIELCSREKLKVGEKEDYKDKWIDRRKYSRRIEDLAAHMEFLQYVTKKHINEREKALSDVRKIIEMNSSCQKIYLWDPYLSANDIIDTLFYCKIFNIEMKAITSRKVVELEEKDVNSDSSKLKKWFEKQKDILNTVDTTGINLEFRCQDSKYGFSFHDRFLIFISEDETSKVWSLGISVNQLGKSHHIIQKTENPGYIADTFEMLWDELSDNSCLIWRS